MKSCNRKEGFARPMAAPPMAMCCKMAEPRKMKKMKKMEAPRECEDDDKFYVDDESARIINAKC